MSQSSLNVSLNHSFTQNEIINYTTYEEQTGVQFTQPINENGSWNSSASVLFSKPFDEKKKLKFSTQTRFNYTNNVGYIKIDKQSERNVSKTTRISENISLSYSNDWFYGQFRTSGTYSTTSNTVSANDNTGLETFNFNISYNTQITLPYSWSVSSDITYSGNRGMSSGYNKNETIWNAQLNKQIFKRKQGSIRFQITDILQQRLSINRNVTANYIEDVQSNAMTGYFMFSFSYRFNNIGGGRGNRGGNRQRGGEMQEYEGGGEMNIERGSGGGNRSFGGGGRGGR